MKAQRLLSMLLLLQSNGRRTARQLAVQLEVSIRTVYRDVDALAEAGVPVYAERGPLGGVVLADGYRRALTQLGEDDLRTLLVTTSDPLADLGFADRRARVSEQLLAALPPGARAAALANRSRVLVDAKRWYQAEQPADVLAALREAAWNDRRVNLQYRDRRGKNTERIADALALVSKAGVWYFVARCAQEYRTFRVERIESVQATGEGFERPADFDLDAYWRDTTQRVQAEGGSYWLTMRVPAHVLAEVAYLEHEVVDAANGIVRVNFGTAGDAAWRLFAWRDEAEVLEPAEFIESLVERARRLIERYGERVTAVSGVSSPNDR
jgi:predicted DNA-binding transcriptional regulator YafY